MFFLNFFVKKVVIIELYEKHNFLRKDIDYLVNKPIREYDMSSGGYSILKKANVFSDKEIKRINQMSKFERNYFLGNYVRDHGLSELQMNGFIDARKEFFIRNNIKDDEVLSIKKDAIFLINKTVTNLSFSGYKFRLDNVYSSYYYLSEIEFYYSRKKQFLDVKGINDEVLKSHYDYFLKDLYLIMKLNEKNNKDYLFSYLKNYREKYLERKLPIEHYRELNEDNSFLTNQKILANEILFDNYENVNDIRIEYNYFKFVIPLIQCIL